MGVPIVTTDATGTAVTPGTHAALGFPGQLRTFADLYYNRYRDYDPTTGRYIQADPIGLEGGDNVYQYALGNPVRYKDPLGLFVPAIVPVAAAVAEGSAAAGGGWAATAALLGGLAMFGPSQDANLDCPDRCKPFYDEIKKRLAELRRRLVEFRRDELTLPEVRVAGYKGRTRIGEAQAFYDAQAGLRRVIKAALRVNCRRIDPEAWRFVTRVLDRRYPQPRGKYAQ